MASTQARGPVGDDEYRGSRHSLCHVRSMEFHLEQTVVLVRIGILKNAPRYSLSDPAFRTSGVICLAMVLPAAILAVRRSYALCRFNQPWASLPE